MITAQDRVYRWRAMASPIALHLPDLDEVLGQAVAQAVAADVERTEQALSRFRETAELVALNARVGRWTEVSDRLYRTLSAARQAVLARRLAQVAQENRSLAQELRQEERALAADSTRATSLRTTLADLKRQKPPAAAAAPTVGNVAVPTVQATTGASGMP